MGVGVRAGMGMGGWVEGARKHRLLGLGAGRLGSTGGLGSGVIWGTLAYASVRGIRGVGGMPAHALEGVKRARVWGGSGEHDQVWGNRVARGVSKGSGAHQRSH
ncbi:hypothetical protein FNV43_RR15014 [Rhamnella rubrinervis]|uniref:Uncharacterized protein n=1 Tax=Rhamnella rubrinervis TaxID=2594499 RepID=A0A8K0E7W4_9ROSA|nr:hypothetical protein FNV43_RR15014 [Rhamnella rubrinervis]